MVSLPCGRGRSVVHQFPHAGVEVKHLLAVRRILQDFREIVPGEMIEVHPVEEQGTQGDVVDFPLVGDVDRAALGAVAPLQFRPGDFPQFRHNPPGESGQNVEHPR